MNSKSVFYPVNLDVSGRCCLVVGGGTVAVRKVSALLLSGALVRVVSPEGCPKLRRLVEEERIEWFQRPFRDKDLDGVFLVFAATNSTAVQCRVARQAKQRGILCNCAESPELSTFQVPARIRRDDFLLTVSTGGASPALSAVIKRRLAMEFGPEYGQLVSLMAAIRKLVLGAGGGAEHNRGLFHAVLEQPVLERIRERDWQGLEKILQDVLPGHIDCAALVKDLNDGDKSVRQDMR